MKNPQKGYLVNINQANVAIDGKARVHKLTAGQPPKCQIEKIEDGHGKWFATEDDCRVFCERNNIDHKGCDHCFPDFC